MSTIYEVLGEVLELYHILFFLKENNRLSSCQMQDNRCELKNPADLLSANKILKKNNTYFKAFSNLVSTSNRANKLSPVGKIS